MPILVEDKEFSTEDWHRRMKEWHGLTPYLDADGEWVGRPRCLGEALSQGRFLRYAHRCLGCQTRETQLWDHVGMWRDRREPA